MSAGDFPQTRCPKVWFGFLVHCRRIDRIYPIIGFSDFSNFTTSNSAGIRSPVVDKELRILHDQLSLSMIIVIRDKDIRSILESDNLSLRQTNDATGQATDRLLTRHNCQADLTVCFLVEGNTMPDKQAGKQCEPHKTEDERPFETQFHGEYPFQSAFLGGTLLFFTRKMTDFQSDQHKVRQK